MSFVPLGSILQPKKKTPAEAGAETIEERQRCLRGSLSPRHRRADIDRRVPRRSAGVGERVPIVELLRALSLYQHVAVVESLEISFDHVGTRVVDPHVGQPMSQH